MEEKQREPGCVSVKLSLFGPFLFSMNYKPKGLVNVESFAGDLSSTFHLIITSQHKLNHW